MRSICKTNVERMSSEPLRVLTRSEYWVYEHDGELSSYKMRAKPYTFVELDDLARSVAKQIRQLLPNDADHNAMDSKVARYYHIVGHEKEDDCYFDFTSKFQDMVADWDHEE